MTLLSNPPGTSVVSGAVVEAAKVAVALAFLGAAWEVATGSDMVAAAVQALVKVLSSYSDAGPQWSVAHLEVEKG